MQVLNPHINMALQCVEQLQSHANALPQSAERQWIVDRLSALRQCLQAAGEDIHGLNHCIAEQARQIYGAVINAQSTTNEPELFCRITQDAFNQGKAQAVDNELRSASVSAPKLVRAMRTNEALGYLDTDNLSSVELFELLDRHYHLPFKRRNFTRYRNK